METVVGGLIGGLMVIAYMLLRINRTLYAESREHRKEARTAQAQVEKLKNELEQQKAIAASTKVATFPTKSDQNLKIENTQLKGEYELLKNEHSLLIDTLNKIQNEVHRPENISSSLAIKIKVHLVNVIGSMAS